MKTRRKWLIGGLATLLLAVAGVAVAQLPNTLNVSSAPSGTAPAIRAAGIDANIGINLVPKGSGTVQVSGTPIVVMGGTVTSLTIDPGPLTVNGSLLIEPGTNGTAKGVGAVIGHNVTATGNTADTNEDTLHNYSVPANTLAADGQSIELDAFLTTAANADTKRLRVRWGVATTVVLDSTAQAFGSAAVSLRVHCTVMRRTSASQVVSCFGMNGGAAAIGQAWNVGLGAGSSTVVAAENLTLAQAFTITGTASAANANDLVAQASRLRWYPAGQ